MNKLTNVTLHGELGEAVGKSWNLAVSSVAEAVRAIEMLSKRKFYRFLLASDKKGVKYRVLINSRDFLYEEAPTLENPASILKTELSMTLGNLKTVDIIPVIEGAGGGVGMIILGSLLVVIGIAIAIIFSETGIGIPAGIGIAVIGLGLIAGGIINLLTNAPKFDAYQDIASNGSKLSYLFGGPENRTKEGGPVPVGYGRLLIGSQVISASYEVTEHDANGGALTV